ncbi:hypothetical protein GCM10022409_36860 [Hymenobacter glaciei]|uniref:Bacterial toxin 23 domain-containing protein n=1 Tax=Hymenobacter glaciei TaxID=877209 RepID=A0ABP7UM76_9BACT
MPTFPGQAVISKEIGLGEGRGLRGHYGFGSGHKYGLRAGWEFRLEQGAGRNPPAKIRNWGRAGGTGALAVYLGKESAAGRASQFEPSRRFNPLI